MGGSPVKRQATIIDKIVTELRYGLGSLLNWFEVPGPVKPMDIYDDLTATRVRVVTGSLFTIISVDGKDFYFHRLTGKYDGSGKGEGDGTGNQH